MKIILKQDINNVGNANDIVTVKDGYARNFLIPKGMAVMATPSAQKAHEEMLKQRQHKEAKLRAEAQAVADKLVTLKLKVGAKVSTTGKIFGSVNNIQLAEAIEKEGIQIERRNIKVDSEHIKELGTYKASVKIYRDIKAEVEFEVVED
jgi:large subunit ribosomal protein L9